jgi:predicted helicase
MFSAWVLWSKSHPSRTARFNWRLSDQDLRVPILRKLFREVADPGAMESMDLNEVLDWAAATLNRVDRTAFFETFEERHAVQYFYEPFLEAFDPELRKDLGVWYTPTEIVDYMVERVDRVLREELALPDGLADPNVYVLDPCCGTGAYLVSVLNRIAETLRQKGGDALLAQDLKDAAIHRVFGFEILPAPFVVAHLQLGLLMQHLGAPFSDKGKKERASVFLTNSLTGWEPVVKPKKLPFVELEEERDAADEVKREKPILVILGNPPYNSFAGIAKVTEERGLSEAYRISKNAPSPQGQGLNDLYVRFFRMAERRIVEKTGSGVVCFISNYSWLDGLSFTAMREKYLEVFDRIWIDNLNGDKYKTGKLTPAGKPDPSAFSTEFNREGIQVGTAISLLVRKHDSQGADAVRFRQMWGKEKLAELLASKEHDGKQLYRKVTPEITLGLPFAPAQVGVDYLSWPLLPELFPVFFPGVKTSRDDVLVDIEKQHLVRRMGQYFDPSLTHDEMRQVAAGAMASTNRFQAEQTRDYLRKRGFKPEFIIPYCYRPFDLRWVYWEPETKLLDEKRSGYVTAVAAGSLWLQSRQKGERQVEGSPFFVTRAAADHHLTRPGCACFPLLATERNLLTDHKGEAANLTHLAQSYGAKRGPADSVWYHALAIGHSHRYLTENSGALWQDWPRIPLPASAAALQASAALGRQVAALLDIEQSVPGVNVSPIRPELRAIGVLTAASGQLDPGAGDLDLTVGWGHGGKGGVTMPGKGKTVERPGEAAYDIYLNGKAFWSNIPSAVWAYTLGGYQVIKKWLSYREKELLGRGLTKQEARHVTDMARRIAALLLLGPALDANYETVKREATHFANKK